MALFRKKKNENEEPDSGLDDGIGMTGALTESKKPGFFSKKKESSHTIPAPQVAPAPEAKHDAGGETNICGICGNVSPAGATVCEICGGSLGEEELEPSGTVELEEEEIPRNEPIQAAPEIPEPEPRPVANVDEEEEEPPFAEPPMAVPEKHVEDESEEEELPAETFKSSEPEPQMMPVLLPKKEAVNPPWTPLPDKQRKVAEKSIKKDVKFLEKEFKKKRISREEHDKRIKKLKIDAGLEPPEPPRKPIADVRTTPPAVEMPPARAPEIRAVPEEKIVEIEEAPEPIPEDIPETVHDFQEADVAFAQEPVSENRPPEDEVQLDFTPEEMEMKTELVDITGSGEQALDKEIDDILPIELLALEELVEEEPEPALEPVKQQIEPEQEKKFGFLASRKIFGDKAKQLEEWEAQLRAEEQNVQASKAVLDNRETKLQEKDMEIQTELQILQTKKKDMTIRVDNITKREAELQQLGGKLAQRAEQLDIRDAEISKREESISGKIEVLDKKETELSERMSVLEKKERDIVSRESETREKWLEMREFDRKIATRSEELDTAEEEINEKRMGLRKKDAELDDKRRELDSRTRELDARTRDLTGLQEQIAAREEKLISSVEENKERSRKLEEMSIGLDVKKEEMETQNADLLEREERHEAWKKRLEAKETELAVKNNELSSKEGAIRTAERELDDRKEKLKARVMEIKNLEDHTLSRKREIDEVELLLIQKENELFNREQGLSRKEAAR